MDLLEFLDLFTFDWGLGVGSASLTFPILSHAETNDRCHKTMSGVRFRYFPKHREANQAKAVQELTKAARNPHVTNRRLAAPQNDKDIGFEVVIYIIKRREDTKNNI